MDGINLFELWWSRVLSDLDVGADSYENVPIDIQHIIESTLNKQQFCTKTYAEVRKKLW